MKYGVGKLYSMQDDVIKKTMKSKDKIKRGTVNEENK